jgi:hypothetical protein
LDSALKPRVFLSHSRKDANFVRRLHQDLLASQVGAWLDTIDIRHGRPWLEEIFEGGISKCDCVVAYYTDDSLTSPVFAREVDASLVAQLEESRIAFLPYVSSEDVRAKLRSDVRALQCPVWNEENYHELLPAVVSEVEDRQLKLGFRQCPITQNSVKQRASPRGAGERSVSAT